MSPLSYSHTLVAGTNENINDVQDMFNDIKTFVDSLETATTNLLGAWRNLIYVPLAEMNPNAAAEASVLGASATIGQLHGELLYFDPADYSISGKTTKLRLRGIASGTTAADRTLTFNLKTVATFSAGGFASTYGSTLGTAAVSLTLAAGNQGSTAVSSEFTAPSAGFLDITAVLSGNVTALNIGALVQIRHT